MRRSARRVITVAAAVGILALTVAPADAATQAKTSPAAVAAPNCGGQPNVISLTGTVMHCTFDDEFDGSSLDRSKWTPVTSATSGLIAGPVGCFVSAPNNISVADGTLNLTARKESTPFVCPDRYGWFASQYTAGQVASSGLFSQTYGRVMIRAKFPAATVAGLQSSLWMWPQNLPATGLQGEIDIAEEYSSTPDRVIPYLHYGFNTRSMNLSTWTNVPTNYTCLIDNVNAFHTYAVEWTPTTLTIGYDGKFCLQDHVAATGPSPFNQPFFIALTQSLGINNNAFNAKTPLPALTQIDYVRAWK
jgi:beta-glucanase (GH16 family)